MKDIKVVADKLSFQGINLDIEQKAFLEEFIELDSMYKPKRFFFSNKSIGNIYLWGPVGRGKTMLLQAVQDCYFSNSAISFPVPNDLAFGGKHLSTNFPSFPL